MSFENTYLKCDPHFMQPTQSSRAKWQETQDRVRQYAHRNTPQPPPLKTKPILGRTEVKGQALEFRVFKRWWFGTHVRIQVLNGPMKGWVSGEVQKEKVCCAISACKRQLEQVATRILPDQTPPKPQVVTQPPPPPEPQVENPSPPPEQQVELEVTPQMQPELDGFEVVPQEHIPLKTVDLFSQKKGEKLYSNEELEMAEQVFELMESPLQEGEEVLGMRPDSTKEAAKALKKVTQEALGIKAPKVGDVKKTTPKRSFGKKVKDLCQAYGKNVKSVAYKPANSLIKTAKSVHTFGKDWATQANQNFKSATTTVQKVDAVAENILGVTTQIGARGVKGGAQAVKKQLGGLEGTVGANLGSTLVNSALNYQNYKSADEFATDVGKKTATGVATTVGMGVGYGVGKGLVKETVKHAAPKVFEQTMNFAKSMDKVLPAPLKKVSGLNAGLTVFQLGKVVSESTSFGDCVNKSTTVLTDTAINVGCTALGQTLIPIPVVGSLVGSAAGSLINHAKNTYVVPGAKSLWNSFWG